MKTARRRVAMQPGVAACPLSASPGFRLGAKAAQEAKTTGEPVKLKAMSPFERKVVHDAVAAAGLRSESEGEEPERCVVVLPFGNNRATSA